MPLPWLHLALAAPLLAASPAQSDHESWSERRAEVQALDDRSVDDATLEEVLHDLAQAAREDPDDGFAGFYAARTASVLFDRLRRRGEFARAGEVLDVALDLGAVTGPMHAHLWIASASLASQLADYDASLRALERAEAALTSEQRDSALPASIWSLRAQAMIQMGLPDQAAPWFERSIELAESLRGTPGFDRSVLIEAYIKRANLRMSTERYERAITELEQVLADEDLLQGNSTARSRFLLRLGVSYLWSVRGEGEAAAEARKRLDEALAEPEIQAQDRLTVHIRLAQLELLVGDVPAAREPLERARALVTQMGGGDAVLAMDQALLSALEARVVRLDPDAGAQARAEARRRLLEAYDAQLANWRTRPDSRTGVGFLRYPAYQDVVVEVLEAELLAAPGEAGMRAAVVQLARARAVGDLADALDAHEPSWDEIAALVPERGGLLVWLGAPGASHVFGVDAAGVAHGRVADLRDVLGLRDDLERLLAVSPVGLAEAALERRQSQFAEYGARLGELLFSPELAQRVAGWERLTLVADDLVGASAIQLVPLRDARGEVAPLCLARPATFLPGLAVGVALAARAATPASERDWERDLCLVADVQPSEATRERYPYVTPLPIDAARLSSWRAAFDAERVVELTGDHATLTDLSAAPAARVQHFVTHGVRDASRVRPAGLALTPGDGEGDLLFGADVERLRAPGLAVLSACCAGRGPERVGDAGASDLSGAFLAAGADAVLLAAIDLPYEPVARYVPLLHAELARGATPAEALHRARLALARDPALADPFHHLAGLRVVGLGHRALFRADPTAPPPVAEGARESEPPPRRYAFGVLIAVAFVVPAWLLLRRRRAA